MRGRSASVFVRDSRRLKRNNATSSPIENTRTRKYTSRGKMNAHCYAIFRRNFVTRFWWRWNFYTTRSGSAARRRGRRHTGGRRRGRWYIWPQSWIKRSNRWPWHLLLTRYIHRVIQSTPFGTSIGGLSCTSVIIVIVVRVVVVIINWERLCQCRIGPLANTDVFADSDFDPLVS